MTDSPPLELRDVVKRFPDGHPAVGGVSQAFRVGEYVCVLGPSGCGKTTLLRLVAGFGAPTAGDILLEGRSVLGVPPERRDVNLVFQDYALFPHLTVWLRIAADDVVALAEDATSRLEILRDPGPAARAYDGVWTRVTAGR